MKVFSLRLLGVKSIKRKLPVCVAPRTVLPVYDSFPLQNILGETNLNLHGHTQEDCIIIVSLATPEPSMGEHGTVTEHTRTLQDIQYRGLTIS